MFLNHRAWGERRLRVGISVAIGLCLVCFFWPGLSVVWGRRAKPEADGRMLFEHEWTENDPLADGDGLGPVFNARSCVACHFQGGVGGAGTNQCNVLAFEVMPTKSNPRVRTGVIHNFATRPSLKEIPEWASGQISSINTPALFGSGLIDRISNRSIQDNFRQIERANPSGKRPSGNPKSLAGRVRILPNGRVGKFGWKAQFATLEEFVAGACANEIGLGTPLTDQAKPLGKPGYWVGRADLDRAQLTALRGFVDGLPRPVQIAPDDEWEQVRAERGESVFRKVGCAACHTPDMDGIQGIYSDFLLHQLEYYGDGEEPTVSVSGDYPLPNEWKTPPLWGVADSAPYFHDGGCESLEGAILRHHGEAEQVRKAYTQLSIAEQKQLLAFLQTLKAPPDAAPARGPGAELQIPELPLRPPGDLLGGPDW